MPLEDGVELVDYLDERSQPIAPVLDFDEVEALPPAQRKARRARDGTRWCLMCDITLRPEGTKAVCDTCGPELKRADGRRRQEAFRERAQQRVQDEGGDPVVVMDATQVEQLRAKSNALVYAIGNATIQFPRSNRTGDWVDDLMHAAKDLQRVMAETLPPERDQ